MGTPRLRLVKDQDKVTLACLERRSWEVHLEGPGDREGSAATLYQTEGPLPPDTP